MDERIEISAGGVVYRRLAGEIEVAIAEQRDRVTAALTTRLPKGKIESGETAEEAAVREVVEEVGLASTVVGDLGSVRYVYNEPSARVTKEVHYFLMEWVPGEPLELDRELPFRDPQVKVLRRQFERPFVPHRSRSDRWP